ncbi:FkbM family methyltransferase [Natrarchaeobaculum sulfurireducens]|uniref:FkbM family methyltransferase n=1 Tax=Natrarchaeobaculum sulfurireducens TaxID=2044521 RepID=UPI000E3E6F10|nr:FkbM family methyltransferase [Natrarchaeobaculum sulfurireducens]
MRRLDAHTRQVLYRCYHRLARVNYDRELVSRRNRTPAGSVRCYEPLNRHATDAMLEELSTCCSPAAVVYDVGAHVGIYALTLASGNPRRRVVAFEPSSTVVDRLRTNVGLNGLERRIDVRPCALGDDDGERSFYRSTNPELSGFDREAATRWGASVAEVGSVPVHCLDSLVGDHESQAGADGGRLPAPDVLKIDVEGAAPSVLRGARATLERHRPRLFIEIHDVGLTGDVPGETKGLLETCDYDVLERADYWRCDPT